MDEYRKGAQPMARTKDLPQIHLSCRSCYGLDRLHFQEVNQLLGLDT